MNIVVCVKYVPDAQGDRSFESDHTTDREAVDGLLSELDEYAVEEALKIKEEGDADTTVTVLTMGPDDAETAVKKSLQMGADQGVHILDDAIAGSDSVATSLILAAAIQKIGDVDLVLTGLASTDGVMSVVPAMLAERLGMPQVTFASELTVDAGAGTVTIRRDNEAYSETVESSLPAVVSVTDQINEPRYPSFKGIMAAKKKPLDTKDLAGIGLSADDAGHAGSATKVLEVTPKPPKEAGAKIEDDGSGAVGAKALVDFLVEKKFI